jgi:DNA-binding MarR family transcriptional regulator
VIKISYELTAEQFTAVHNELAMLNAKLAGQQPEPEIEEVIGGLEGPEAALTASQYRTWSYLRAREEDCPNGVSISSVARHFGINASAASQRLNVLKKMGYSDQVRKGYYRVTMPTVRSRRILTGVRN